MSSSPPRVEFMHTATLLHDDVVDESDMRRGKLSARMLWGNEASVLVGDFLLGQAFRMMVEVGSLRALDILSSAAAVIAEGEVMQLAAAKNTETTEDEYLAVIRGKTAELFAAACEVGPVIADRPKAEQAACRSYGMNLGIAFQLVDDALDYGGKSAKLGKNVGDDFREGKITLRLPNRTVESELNGTHFTLCLAGALMVAAVPVPESFTLPQGRWPAERARASTRRSGPRRWARACDRRRAWRLGNHPCQCRTVHGAQVRWRALSGLAWPRDVSEARDLVPQQAIAVDKRQRVVREGVLVEALNPKTAAFFWPSIPQFVDPAKAAVLRCSSSHSA